MASAVLLQSLGSGVLLDQLGNALSNHQVYVYQRGTSTQVQVYSDSGLTIPLSQPLLTGANGASPGGIPGYVAAEQAIDLYDAFTGVRMPADPISALDVAANNVFYARAYKVKADGKTVTDAAINAGQAALSSASAGFTVADQGKRVVVIGAGAAGAHLYTTIQSVSGGVATLAATAGTTVTGAECFYASDDTTAAQACITAAAAAGGTAIFPEGDIGISAPLVAPASQSVSIIGTAPLRELFGGTTQNNDANFPTIAPYLKGTVFVQCSPNVDAIQLNAQGIGHHLKWIGVRFAGRYLNTGHGVTSVPTGGKLGNMGGVFEDVRVFGHDGNHYGHVIDSPLYMRWAGLRSYGGGGIWLKTNASAPGPPGNITSLDTLSYTIIGGTAHGFFIDCSAAVYFDYCVFINAEHIVSAPNPALGTLPVPTSAQKCLNTSYSVANPTMQTIGFVNPCMETNVSSTTIFPAGPGCYRTNDCALSTIANPALPSSPASGTAYQNLLGKPMSVIQEFTLQPAAAATASTTTTAIVASGATSLPVTSSAGFSAGQGVQIGSVAGGDLEFVIVASVPDGTHITVTSPGNYGVIFNHSSGVNVQAGAAVVYGETASTSAFPQAKWAHQGIAIGASPVNVSFNFPLPSAWYYRITWANASRMWTDYVGSFG